MNSEIWQVVAISLQVALLTSILVMCLSFLLALGLKSKKNYAAKLLEFLIYIPMSMPPIAVGYGLLIIFGPSSFIGTWLYENYTIRIAFDFLGALVAAFIVSFGIGLKAMILALENINEHHSEIAELLGASKLQVFMYITFPLSLRSLLGGAVLVFLRSLGEFGATIILAGNTLGSTRTLSLAIWTEMQKPGQESMALSLVITAAFIAFLALLASEFLLRKKPIHK